MAVVRDGGDGGGGGDGGYSSWWWSERAGSGGGGWRYFGSQCGDSDWGFVLYYLVGSTHMVPFLLVPVIEWIREKLVAVVVVMVAKWRWLMMRGVSGGGGGGGLMGSN